MPSSNQQTPASPELLGPTVSSTLRPLDGVSSNFDRSRLGIPAEDDEFTRGLTFFFDPSTGQSSVPSPSQEFVDPDEASPYGPSPASTGTSSRKVFTPQSVSDDLHGLHPRMDSSKSVGITDSGSSDEGVDHPHPPLICARASTGMSHAALSPLAIQTPIHLPPEGSHTVTTMSLAPNLPIPEPFGPLEDTSNPRRIINLDPNDLACLEEIMSLEGPSRRGNPAGALDPMDLMNDQISRSVAPPNSESVQRSKKEDGEVQQRIGTKRGAMVIRTPKVSRPPPDPTGRRASTKDAKAKMRDIGSCLPCLVNHEQVSG